MESEDRPNGWDRLSVLERAGRKRDEEIMDLRGNLLILKELVGSDIRAHELFKKLIVSIDDPQSRDFDTIILTSDEQRGYLRNLVTREKRREFDEERWDRRRSWLQTKWGRAAAFLGGFSLLINIIGSIYALIHR